MSAAQEFFDGLEDVGQSMANAEHKAAAKRRLVHDTKRVNLVLQEMFTNNYTDGVPLDRVNDALHTHGFNELEPMILCGREGRLHENVGRNRWLSLTWYKMESGRYEVVAYVS